VIQVNLLPKEERLPEPALSVQAPRARVWVTALVAGAILVPLGGLYLMQQSKISLLKSDISAAQLEKRKLQPQIDRITQLMNEREQLNLRLSVIQQLTRQRYLAVQLLDDVAAEVPDYLWLTKVAESGPGQITVEGMTFTNLMVAELMNRMEESQLFSNVALGVAEKAKLSGSESSDRPVYRFAVTARMKP
jgi:type IV pilus assembly protein PilN